MLSRTKEKGRETGSLHLHMRAHHERRCRHRGVFTERRERGLRTRVRLWVRARGGRVCLVRNFYSPPSPIHSWPWLVSFRRAETSMNNSPARNASENSVAISSASQFEYTPSIYSVYLITLLQHRDRDTNYGCSWAERASALN